MDTSSPPPVIVTGRRPPRRRRSGGAASIVVSLVIAAAAIGLAAVAWPVLHATSGGPKPAIQTAASGVAADATKPSPKQPPKPRPVPQVPRGESPASGTPRPEPAPPESPSRPTPSPPSVPSAATDVAPAVPRGDAAAVTAALAKTLESLRKGDDAGASKALAAARQAADHDPDLSLRLERWGLLVDYARQLADQKSRALAAANAGREYEVGDRVIAIIEITDETYAYKDKGRIQRGHRSELPRAIDEAILATWFAGSPRAANHILLGVHRLLDPNATLTDVRREWDVARAGEPDAVASILPLLDDEALRAAVH